MTNKDDKREAGIPDKKELGRLWYVFRVGLGLSKTALAKMARVSRGKVARVESGDTVFNQVDLHNIEASTGIPVHQMMSLQHLPSSRWQLGYDALPAAQKAAANDMITATITVINDHCGKAS